MGPRYQRDGTTVPTRSSCLTMINQRSQHSSEDRHVYILFKQVYIVTESVCEVLSYTLCKSDQ